MPSHRVLTSAHNFSLNVLRIDDDESSTSSIMQTSKPKQAQSSLPIKPVLALAPKEKHSSESRDEWPSISKSASLDSSCSEPSLQSENDQGKTKIFRSRLDMDGDMENMLVLKRASPVYDSEDEEDFICSPTKKQRTTGSSSLFNDQVLAEDEVTGFNLTDSLFLR